MRKRLIYFALLFIVPVVIFKGYLEYSSWKNKQPIVYIDNFSGDEVEIFKLGNTWFSLSNGESAIRKDIQAGRVNFHTRKVGSGIIDSFSIDIEYGSKYLINLYEGMSYYIGEIVYAEHPGELKSELSNGNITSEKVLEINFDYVFETPPRQVSEYISKEGTSLNYNVTTKKTYIRRIIGDQQKVITEADSTPIDVSRSKHSQASDIAIVKEILSEIKYGKTREAIENFAKLYPEKSSILQKRYTTNQEEYQNGLITFENWLVEETKIDLAIYEALPLAWIEKKEFPIETITKLLEEGQIISSLDILIDAGSSEATLTAGALAKAKKKYTQGVISKETYLAIEARKKDAIKFMLR